MRAPRPTGSEPVIDWLKALAIIAVVTAHCGPWVFSPETFGLDKYIRVTVAAFNVPIFLLVSGYLHATVAPIGGAVLAKRWRSIVPPYLLASIVMLACGVEWPQPLSEWPFALATGNGPGMYYYVPVWLFCVLTGCLWSRVPDRWIGGALLFVLALTMVRHVYVDIPMSYVWLSRDPLLQGWLLCYVFGWCARRLAWDAWVVANRWSIVLACACCFRWVAMPDGAPPMTKIVYSVGVAWLVVALVVDRPAPRVFRWLAGETLLIYLWHLPIALAVLDQVRGWPALLRIPTAVTLALAGTSAGILIFRRLQGLWRSNRLSAADERVAA